MAAPESHRSLEGTTVPKKLYYRIGEACRAVDIQPYVLRYWETEFEALAPGKSKSGQRVYTEEEIDRLRVIKSLVDEAGINLAGVERLLSIAEVVERMRPLVEGGAAAGRRDVQARLSAEIDEILRLLGFPGGR